MSKYLSREFLLTLGLIAIATIALFLLPASLTEWGMVTGAFLLTYAGAKTVQKVKRDPMISKVKGKPVGK